MPLKRVPIGLKQADLIMLALNIAVLVIYLVLSSLPWDSSDAGGVAVLGLVFIAMSLVVWMLNLVWGGFILAYRYWQGGRLWLLAAMMWSVLIAVIVIHSIRLAWH